MHRVARLATVALLALAVRAADAQQPQFQPWPQAPATPPGYPAQEPGYPGQPPGYSGQQPAARPTVNQTLRFPLPSAPPPNAAQPPIAAASAAIAAPPPQRVLFQPGQIVARVGDKTILYCDVAPTVNMIMEPALAKSKNAAEREAIESQRELLTRNVVQQQLQNKMLLLEFERDMPSNYRNDKKKRAEAEDNLKKNVRKAFDATLSGYREKIANASPDEIEKIIRQDPTVVRLAVLMKEKHLETLGELDVALRQYGTSLEQQIRDFGEYQMGLEAARKKMKLGKNDRKEVTHQEMLDYYQEHLADYYIPAKARFELLTARFAKFGGDRAATSQAIVEMGNAVYFGAPFEGVARKLSQEPKASDGGQYDWITPGSLASKPIDRAVFTLEVGKLSQIIEDELGFHIVRVKERQEAGQVSFTEAQPEIKKAIDGQRRIEDQQKYLADLRGRTKVWTIFDPPTVASQPDGPTRR